MMQDAERGEALLRLAGRWRLARLPAVAAVLVVVERALIGEVGSPMMLLRALLGLGGAWADPVVSVLALMGLLAETLIGYVLVVLVLRWLCVVPGAVGRVAGRMALRITPAIGRRALDLLVGGSLLAQATLAATPVTPGGHRPDAPGRAMAVSTTSTFGSVQPLGATATWPRPPWSRHGRAGLWTCGRRAQRGPPPAGQRRHCRPGWGAGRPRRHPGTPWRRATRCGTSRPPTSPRPSGRWAGCTATGSRCTGPTDPSSAPTPT